MNSEPCEPFGNPLAGTAVVGSFALALGLVTLISGALAEAGAALAGSYQEAGFSLEAVGTESWWSLLVVAVVSYGVAWILLETPGVARRVILLVTVLVLAAAGSPVMALWGVFWCPMVTLISGVCSGLLALLWAWRYPMPCEGIEALRSEKVIPMTTREERAGGRAAPETKNRTRRAKR